MISICICLFSLVIDPDISNVPLLGFGYNFISLAEAIMLLIPLVQESTVRFSVVMLSQPVISDGVLYVATAVPPDVMVLPFQL